MRRTTLLYHIFPEISPEIKDVLITNINNDQIF